MVKFSHRYVKMPETEGKATMLLQVLLASEEELSEDFVKYDTAYSTLAGYKYYELPKGKLLILLLLTDKHLWTTIRRWTPEKEKYYRGLVGKKIEVEYA